MTGSLQKTQTTERYGKKMDSIKVSALYNTEETIAKELFKDDCYPWEILPKIKDFILTLGPTLPKDKFDEIEKNVWVAKSAVVAKRHLSQDHVLLTRIQKFVIVLLSMEMHSLESIV